MRYLKFVLTTAICFMFYGCLFAQQQSIPGKPGSDLPAVNSNNSSWPAITLAQPDEVQMRGPLEHAFQLGLHRMSLPPYTADWLLSDVSFQIQRIFTNYSGDVSGRFIQLCALTSPPGHLWPATLPAVLHNIVKYQNPDGHFGVPVDWSKPLVRGDSAITLLWGNARLLVGLVAAAQKLHDTVLLNAAKSLGDFYVNTADELCNPKRMADYKSSGTGGDSYTCCYFPAIESLALLYNATKDVRYLHQAERMAKFFLNFDRLPIDHAHGNLSAWRGILDIYGITHQKHYLQDAINKWDEAVDNGFVWPVGGVGEHWYVQFNGDEGCAESDWLRFNLILWRFTGDNRYLDVAQRLLQNQYLANQTPDGGYGMRYYDDNDNGPIGTYGAVSEWDFCCNFAGPLGLYFLKSYLATSSAHNIYINFPFAFSAPIKVNNTLWKVNVNAPSQFNDKGEKKLTIEVTPEKATSPQPVSVLFRIPSGVTIENTADTQNDPVIKNGYIVLTSHGTGKNTFTINLKGKLQVEGRRFTHLDITPDHIYHFKNVSLVWGSDLLYQLPAQAGSASTLLAMVNDHGRISLLQRTDSGFASVILPALNLSKTQILSDINTGQKVSLTPWPVHTTKRTAFVYNMVIVPQKMIPQKALYEFRLKKTDAQMLHYGSDLQKQKDLWPTFMHWHFTPQGILINGSVRGADVGLIEGKGYKNYKFSFDMTLPEGGEGISGWVVRAKDAYNYILFQLQSSDTKYNDPQYKTKPNTLRPIICKNGKLTVLDPIPLKETILTGKAYHITTVCNGNHITVFIDDKKVYEHTDEGFNKGAVGFRVSGELDQGLFNNISLQQL